jgi:uncharacterized repeat protein (TIGR02543 family)
VLPKYRLTLTKTGAISAGRVSSSPSGISCGTRCSSTSASFTQGASVTLTATKALGKTFTGWGGACSGTTTTCNISMTGAKSVTAGFKGTFR